MEKDKLDANDYSIKDYLSESEFFLVPRYQRNYAWEKENIEQLLKDVSQEKDYYIGNVIVNLLDTNTKEIIDGQQRIISIFLIMIALYHVGKRKILKYVVKDGKLKISIEKRIEDSGVSVMKAILDDKVPATMSKYYEVKRFKDIKGILSTYSEEELNNLTNNLLKAQVVEIKFFNGEKRAHEMFVNLNTKGKPLEEIEIIKSHLFKYLAEGNNSDFYKEEWYEMLNVVGDKYYGKYLQNISLLRSGSKEKKTARGALNYLLGEISDDIQAKDVFDFMAGDENIGLFKVFSAVKNHDLLRLRSYIGHESEISMDVLDKIWRMFGQIKFEQFDVVMVALLYCPTKEKKKELCKKYLSIVKFLKLILFFQIHNTVHRVSPSTYTNRFETAAIDIYNHIPLDDVMRKLIDDLKIYDVTKEQMTTAIKNLKCSADKKAKNKNTRDLKIAKYIIQMIDENYMEDLKAEHIICEKNGSEPLVYKIGNILPVVKDRYKEKNVEEKLIMYAADAEINSSIKKLFEMGITKDNYETIIKNRTDIIAENFWNIFEGLRNESNN